MKKLLSIIALLTATLMLFVLAGCGGDDDDDDDCADAPAPSVKSVTPPGGNISSNSTITVEFSKKMKDVTITINGAAVAATSGDNKVYTFQPGQEGALALAISGTDDCDQALDPGYAGASYTAAAPDSTAPEIDDGGCDPENGDDGIDPADVEEIVIKFSEVLKAAEVTSFEPEDAKIDSSLDGDTMTIAFLGGYSLGNEMEIAVELAVEDLAGNTADLDYEFATMAKE